jgi:hypothetical protein
MFNILSHKGNASQNNIEIPSHPSQNGYHQESKQNKCWQGRGGKAALICCVWECKLVQPLWKSVWRFLKKLKIDLPSDPDYV